MNQIIDMHCDTVMALMGQEGTSLRSSANMVDAEKLRQGGYMLQCFAMFVKYRSRKKENYSPFFECNRMIDRFWREVEANADVLAPAFTYEDIVRNAENGRITALLTIEEGGVLEGNIEFLRNFWRLGVRMMTLTWNFKNEIASPNIDFFKLERGSGLPAEPNTEEGLTDFGVEVVREMNRLGMVIDCSHIGDKSFYDVIRCTAKPIVCSHSCARSVCGALRNMTDDMLLKLRDNGGVVGINYCHDFVKDDPSVETVEDVVAHINHIRDLIGIDYIGLGSDFDGIGNEDIELKDASMMGRLLDELRAQNYTQEEIDKITHLNVLRVFKANFGE